MALIPWELFEELTPLRQAMNRPTPLWAVCPPLSLGHRRDHTEYVTRRRHPPIDNLWEPA